MTPAEFKTEMQRISEMGDPEYRHQCMDDLLIKCLRSLGYGDGVNIFVETDKWYA